MARAIISLILLAVFSVAYSGILIKSGLESINIEKDHVKCGNLICPPGSTGCVHKMKNNELNNTLVDVTRRCVGPHQTITAEQNEIVEATDGEQYDSYSSIGGDSGRIVLIGNLTDYNNKNANQFFERRNVAMQDSQKKLKDVGVPT